MKLDIRAPMGETPQADPRVISERQASRAVNMDFKDGTWETYKGLLDLEIDIRPSTRTIYKFNPSAGGFWFQFDEEVDVIRSPIANDPFLRTMIFGDGEPRFTTLSLAQTLPPYPSASYRLGIPPPANAIVAEAPAVDMPEDAVEVNANYVMTFVDQFGAESPPSDVSNDVVRWDGAEVVLTSLPIASGDFVINSKRLYRSELSGSFLYLSDIAPTAETFTDNIDSNQLGLEIPSTTWFPPPAELKGAVSLPNGVLVGWHGNTLAFSEPYLPHAWPPEYERALDNDIVSVVVTGAGALVTTTGKPYLLSGIDPNQMGLDKIDEVRACVSKGSSVDMGTYTIYASIDGLVAAGGTEAKLITDNIITSDQFQALNPQSFRAYRYQNKYLCFYDGGSFMFSPTEGMVFFDEEANCAFLDENSGRLYVVASDGSLMAWDEGDQLTGLWTSKVFQTPRDKGFSFCKVDAETYPQPFDFYRDGELIKTKNITNNKPFRLPTRSRYREEYFTYRGTGGVNRIQLSENLNELT